MAVYASVLACIYAFVSGCVFGFERDYGSRTKPLVFLYFTIKVAGVKKVYIILEHVYIYINMDHGVVGWPRGEA